MRFSRKPTKGHAHLSLPVKLMVLFFGWLAVISVSHYWLNIRQLEKENVVRMGYMPVVTNLAAPLLDHVSKYDSKLRFKALKFSSFAEMAEALRNGNIQVAFIIAPLAIVLRQQGVDVKVVMIGNRHESTLVAKKALQAKSLEDLTGSTIAVPMRFSGHNLCMLKEIETRGLSGKIKIVEMNPPDMASALTSGALDAYFVGEPFAAQTVLSGDADVVAHVESLWPNFICNLLLVKNDWLSANPDLVQTLVEMAARSGLWAREHPDQAARIVSGYWNQPVQLVRHALTVPTNRIRYEMFVPKPGELQMMADLMVRFNLIEQADINGLVDNRFALAANTDGIAGFKTIRRP